MRYPDQNSVGIVSTGMYPPERVVTAADITVESGIEERVIREKFGSSSRKASVMSGGQLVSDGVQLKRE